MRKKLIILFFLGLGAIATLATLFYIKPTIMDVFIFLEYAAIVLAFAAGLVFRKKLIILYSVGLGTIIILATYLYQVTHSMMEVFTVIAFAATFSAFAVTLVYAIVRKKLIILYSAGLGTIMTLVTYLYQVKPHVMDAIIVNHGFPLKWLSEWLWGWGGPTHHFTILWGSLLLDIIFWSIIAFIIIVMIKVSIKSRQS